MMWFLLHTLEMASISKTPAWALTEASSRLESVLATVVALFPSATFLSLGDANAAPDAGGSSSARAKILGRKNMAPVSTRQEEALRLSSSIIDAPGGMDMHILRLLHDHPCRPLCRVAKAHSRKSLSHFQGFKDSSFFFDQLTLCF